MAEAHLAGPQDMPRVLLFSAAIAGGVILALAAHIALSAWGLGLASLARELFSSSTDQARSAVAWWIIALSGCAGSWGAVLLVRKPATKSADRVRLAVAIALFLALTAAGQESAPAGIKPAAAAVAGIVAAFLGAFMAYCTAHFVLAPERLE